MISKEFITAGRATFTVVVGEQCPKDAKDHYTYRIVKKVGHLFGKEVWFASLMTGSDNERSYSYIGLFCPHSGTVTLRGKTRFVGTETPVLILQKVLARIWAGQGQQITAAAGWDVKHCGRCGKCARKLTHPESIDSGIGPECSGKGYSKKSKLIKVEN